MYLAMKHAHLFPDGIFLYEKRADYRNEKVTSGTKYINLSVSSRLFHTLRQLDPQMEQEVKNLGVKTFGRVIHDKQGKSIYTPYTNLVPI